MVNFTLPNFLTGVRALLAPVLFWLIIRQQLSAAFAVLFFAALTDWADGFIARTTNAITHLGRILDPLADKILVFALYSALVIAQKIPVWVAIIVILRDVMIISAIFYLWYQGKKIQFAPLFISKFNTFLQFLLCIILLFPPLLPEGFIVMLVYGTLITTILSGSSYARVFFKTCTQ